MAGSPQIPLPLEPHRRDRLDDFVAGRNLAALAAVRQLLDESGAVLFLSGPAGSGKSHLLNALCLEARARSMTAYYFALASLPVGAAGGVAGLRGADLVCIDDIHAVAGQPDWEQALFHSFNEVRAARGRLLVSSALPLAALEFGLPDLASRLAWGVQQLLQPPDDAGRLAILQQRARALQIELPTDVQNYLLRYSRRDMASLLGSLERLKDVAFADKRRITVPLAREVLYEAAREP